MKTHQASFKLPAKPVAAAVLCTGPEPATNRDGDEIPVWFVSLVDSDGEPVSRVYKVYACWRARLLAAQMADDRNCRLSPIIHSHAPCFLKSFTRSRIVRLASIGSARSKV